MYIVLVIKEYNLESNRHPPPVGFSGSVESREGMGKIT